MGLTVNRYHKTCDLCGGRIQCDTLEYPGEGENAAPVQEVVESHLGSCTPKPSEEVIPGQTT